MQEHDAVLSNPVPSVEPVTDEEEHRWLGYENPVPGRFVAVCSCGWRSAPFTSAGLAGSASDQHRRDVGVAD